MAIVNMDRGRGPNYRPGQAGACNPQLGPPKPAKAAEPRYVWMPQLGAIVAFVVGTGGLATTDFVLARDSRGYQLPQFRNVVNRRSSATKLKVRSPAENLARVREVFEPSVTDLAGLFGVSRQAIYKWQAGDPISARNEERLADLARAADKIVAEGLNNRSSLLRRKLPGGRTFFEAVRAGEPADAAAKTLISLLDQELAQRRALAERLSKRTRKPVELDKIGSPYVPSEA